MGLHDLLRLVSRSGWVSRWAMGCYIVVFAGTLGWAQAGVQSGPGSELGQLRNLSAQRAREPEISGGAYVERRRCCGDGDGCGATAACEDAGSEAGCCFGGAEALWIECELATGGSGAGGDGGLWQCDGTGDVGGDRPGGRDRQYGVPGDDRRRGVEVDECGRAGGERDVYTADGYAAGVQRECGSFGDCRR